MVVTFGVSDAFSYIKKKKTAFRKNPIDLILRAVSSNLRTLRIVLTIQRIESGDDNCHHFARGPCIGGPGTEVMARSIACAKRCED